MKLRWNSNQTIKTKVVMKKVNPGRLELSFSESSERTKRRKAEQLRANVSTEVLVYSATSKLRSEGNTDSVKMVRDISKGTPTKALNVRRSLEYVDINILTTNEALSLFIELGLSRNKYQQLRNAKSTEKVQEDSIV